jgi:hypothetical protein
MKVDEEPVTALRRKVVRAAILGRLDPINEHLDKLIGFGVDNAALILG